MTEGMRTSEIYIAIAGVVLGFAAAFYGVGGGEIGAALVPAVTYIGGRSYVKKT